jgi:hypothetical protein
LYFFAFLNHKNPLKKTMKEEIRQLIGKGKLEEALNKLLPFSEDVILLKAQLAGAKRDSNMGVIERREFAMIMARINYATLNLLDDIELPESSPTSNTANSAQSTEKTVATSNKIPKIFISYSHNDNAFLDDLLVQLKPLERRESISIWTDDKILPGADWSKTILDNLNNSNIVVMLLSPDFLASDYIHKNEVRLGLENRKNGATVLPVIIRTCMWKEALPDLASIQAMPQDEERRLKPITKWSDRDEAWYNVAKGIIAVVDNMKK